MLLGVDVGGTFTDAVLVASDGTTYTAKAPSTPGEQQIGVMATVEAVLARAGVDAGRVERFAHGMTVATNALLEISESRPPARTAFVATEGFTDIVELGRQARPSLYRLCETGPRPLAPADLRFGASERMGPEGPLQDLDQDEAEALVERLAEAKPEAVAVVLLHSYAHPEHEQMLGGLIAKRLKGAHLSLSHELVGTFREYERASTTEIDAALSPLLAAYLTRIGAQATERGLPEAQIMQSSGGLTDADRAAGHAALTVLSGPAGGVGGALLLSEAAGEPDVLCFDMGGTSCDVCVIEGGTVAETAERKVAGRPMALPALDIHTVGAGGGSIAWRDEGGALRVGPQSAGAHPGPACYGLGGELATVTDANLVLGRLLADAPLAGGVTLDRAAAQRAVEALARELGIEPIACAEGIVKVAETEMRRALGVMTIERGVDPRDFALMPFGGAGPLHAAAMAVELGIGRVLCPRACGVLSALGLAAAAPRRDASRTAMLRGESFTSERVAEVREKLIERATSELDGPAVRIDTRYELRYAGQSFELSVEADIAALRAAFEDAHEQRYGYRDEDCDIELVNVRVSVWGARPLLTLGAAEGKPPARETTPVVFDGKLVETQLWRGELPTGLRIEGPALCAMAESTLLVPPGWAGSVDGQGTVVLERAT
jgi:N-methylhydantoinase A